jgi:hypothetical protein
VRVHRQVLAAAERATDPCQRQPDLLGWEAEGAADLLLVDVQPLGRHEQVDAAVLGGHGQPGLRPEEGLVLHPDLVLARHDDVGCRRGRLDVTLADLQVPDLVALGAQQRGLAAVCRSSEGLFVPWPRAVRASVTGSSTS